MGRRFRRTAILMAAAAVPSAAQAACPDDVLEALAMIGSGGIYCQYDAARDILNDLKADLQRIHGEGQQELDRMKLEYLQTSAARKDDAARRMEAIQREIDKLIREAQGIPQRLHNQAISTVPVAEAPAPPMAAAQRVESSGGFRASAAATVATGNPLAKNDTEGGLTKPSTGAISIGPGLSSDDQRTVERVKGIRDEIDTIATGTLRAAMDLVDAATATAQAEMNEGFETSLFAPLAAIGAGIPPPDPATIVVFWAASQVKLLEALEEKNRVIADLRQRNDAKLAEQSDQLEKELAHAVMKLKAAEEVVAKLRQARSNPSPENDALLQAALTESSTEFLVRDSARVVQGGGNPWSRIRVSSTGLTGAVNRATRRAQAHVPPAASAAQLAAIESTTRPRIDQIKATGQGLASYETEAQQRFADSPALRDLVVEWIRRVDTP